MKALTSLRRTSHALRQLGCVVYCFQLAASVLVAGILHPAEEQREHLIRRLLDFVQEKVVADLIGRALERRRRPTAARFARRVVENFVPLQMAGGEDRRYGHSFNGGSLQILRQMCASTIDSHLDIGIAIECDQQRGPIHRIALHILRTLGQLLVLPAQ